MKLNRYFTKTCARPVAISLLATIACALMIFAPGESFSSPQKTSVLPVSTQKEDHQATMARRELNRIPVAKIQKIPDAKLRKAILETRAVMAQIANNRSKSQEATLLRIFDAKLKVLQDSAQSSEYKTGAFKCLGDYHECVKNKCKIGCGCGFAFVGCLVIEIVGAIS